MTNKIVFLSGNYDLLHSEHLAFFRKASEFGNVGCDDTGV